MKYFIGLSAAILLVAGIASELTTYQSSDIEENYGWQAPPKTQEDKREMYGDSAPEYPTVSVAIQGD